MFTCFSCAGQNVASVMDTFRENCPTTTTGYTWYKNTSEQPEKDGISRRSHLRERMRGVSQALISLPLHHRPSAPRHPIIYHSLGGDFTPAFTCLVLNNRTKCTKFTCDQHCCQLYLHVSSARSSLRHSNILFVTRVI